MTEKLSERITRQRAFQVHDKMCSGSDDNCNCLRAYFAHWAQEARRMEAAMDTAYGYCEGSGGHYKDAVEAIMATLADYFWPPKRKAPSRKGAGCKQGAHDSCPGSEKGMDCFCCASGHQARGKA